MGIFDTASREARSDKAEASRLNLAAMGLGFKMKDGNIYSTDRDQKGVGGPIVGAKASIETAGEIESRFTATRILAVGVFALAFKKKKDSRAVYITIEGDDYVLFSSVDPKKDEAARRFVAKFNAMAGSRSEVVV